MRVLQLCSGRRAQAGILKHLYSLSVTPSRTISSAELRNPSRSSARPLSNQTRLNMPPPPHSIPSEQVAREIRTVGETLQTVRVFQTATPVPASRTAGNGMNSQPELPKTNGLSAREAREAKVDPSKASGGIPNPSKAYIAASNVVPQPLPQPQHLLVVIDLNGTLLFRPSRKQPTKFIARPNTIPFLKYCVDTFSVVIWSSARPENVANMCNAILTPELRSKVIAIWGRDKFGLSRQDFDLRVQCYKRLTKLWGDQKIAKSHPEYEAGGRWNQTNTVLVDDSLEKGRSEPYNLIEVPEFFGNANEQGRILPQVHDYLNHLSMHSNVSACLRMEPFKAQIPP